MDTNKLKYLALEEMSLRDCTNSEQIEKWVQSVKMLRIEIPDWCCVVLELIAENEVLRAKLEAAEQRT
ncbi:hypothetical protein [Pseudomonas sp. TMB3-21]